ncbi:polysaccharide synthesis protein GtrA [Enterobacterales bacterium CwR94]|nr:polysaccharide synthesis protein GtrA [Enterobacterales bacterium CwR94]
MSVFVKYLAVGVINTLITAVIIFLLLRLGQNAYLANALGYVVGIGVSFCLNAVFTFGVALTHQRLFRFLSVCAISYLINLITLHLFYTLLPEHLYSGQLTAMVLYTLTGFLLNKYWGLR